MMQSSKQEKMFALLESRDSDQSVSSFCKEQGIKEASFYYWRKKYRENNPEEQTAGFATVEVAGPAGNPIATVQLAGGALITLFHPEAFTYIQPLL
jgi:transposase-like protein